MASEPDAATLVARIKAEAARLGFAACGVLAAGPTRSHAFYEAWLAAGYAGPMGYLRRHAPMKADPRALLPAARSVLALTWPYGTPPPNAPEGTVPRGRVSRYAWGGDYHDVLTERLGRLAAFVSTQAGRPVRTRACVDSAPVLEREQAARAGLGWVGRNAMLIHWRRGSWLFLAELLLELELPPDTAPAPQRPGPVRQVPPPAALARAAEAAAEPPLRESCGFCVACIEACPTGAIVGDKTVDARRCISTLTIELKEAIPAPLRPNLGAWVFGCDVCQDVCPWNRRAPYSTEPAFRGDAEAAFPSLPALLALDDAAFRERFRHTPLWRPRRRGLLRNAAIAMGNHLAADRTQGGQASDEALNALRAALDDPEPLVRGAAAWALGRSRVAGARNWLQAALEREPAVEVQTELRAALAGEEPAA